MKRLRVRAAGGYEPFWKVKPITVALEDNDYRVPLQGLRWRAQKSVKRRTPEGPAAHIEHKLKSDSEYCASGLYLPQGHTTAASPEPSATP